MQPEDQKVEGEAVEIPEEEEVEVTDTEDGGAMIRVKDAEDVARNEQHFANIVEEVDKKALDEIVSDLLDKLERDKEARAKRDKQYEEGLRRTGMGDDAPGGAQFTGATRVVHPMLVQGCVDFSARAMKEIFPPSGPVKSKVIGRTDKDKADKAERKTDYMNWQCTQQIKEFRGELEQLTTQLPLGGGQYMKLFFNKELRRTVVEFVPIDDMLLPFAATNFYTAERKTHVQYITKATYQKRVKAGMYIDVDLSLPTDPERSRSSVANDKIEGRKETSYNEDGLRKVFEVYTCCDFGEGREPYVLTIDDSSRRALSLYRNWEVEDESKQELDWIVEFGFIPWRGAYPIGLTHLIGGLSGAATGALRALMDSAHIQNIPTMLKLKGGPNGQTLSVQPVSVTEIEGGAMVDDIRKLVMPVPFNAPSPVLFELMGFLVNAGKEVVQTSFDKLSDQNPNQPVGTTMALIEQGMVVFSSIHTRLHASMARVFEVMHRINSSFLTEEDIERETPEIPVQPSDFDGPIDVIPVSDPNIFSETQRFAQVQSVMQRAQALPQMYNARRIEEMFLRAMKLPDDLLVPEPGQDDMDPVSENVAASMGRPVYVLPKQDHMAHMQVHMAFLQSPLFGANPAIVKTFLFPMATHLRDHILNYYMAESKKAVKKGQDMGVIQEDTMQQAQMIGRVQALIEQQMNGFAQQLAQIDQSAQQYKPQPPMPPDNSMQVAQINAQVQQAALQQRSQTDAQRMQIEQQKLQQKAQADQAKMAAEAQKQAAEAQQAGQEAQMRAATEQMRQQAEDRRQAEELAVRERINQSDNDTAMRLAAAEIASGERVAVSTGGGINPNP